LRISNNKTVTIEYAVHDEQRQFLDNSRDSGPLSYVHGKGKIVAGLEAGLEGRQAGDTFSVTLSPEHGYGERDESRLHEFTAAELSGLGELKVGMQLQAKDESGKRILTVSKIEDGKIILDENHPLSGKTVTFNVHVLSVRDATGEEIESGQAYDVSCNDDCSSCASNIQYDGSNCGCGCGHH